MNITLNHREVTLLLVSMIHRLDLIKSRPDLSESYEETRILYKRIYGMRKEYESTNEKELYEAQSKYNNGQSRDVG